LTDDDAGANGYKVYYWKANTGDNPSISGGSLVTGWTLHDVGKNIWSATVPGFSRQLFVNGNRRRRVRYTGGSELYLDNTSYFDVSGAWPALSRFQDIEFIFEANASVNFGDWNIPLTWAEIRVGVVSGSNDSGSPTFNLNPNMYMTVGVENLEPSYPSEGGPTSVENAYEFLTADTKGEFYINPVTNTIYYVPTDIEAATGLNNCTCVVPLIENILISQQANPVHDIEFSGIDFVETTWLAPTTDDIYFAIGNGNYHAQATPSLISKQKAALSFSGVSDVSFSNCDFARLGGAGIDIGAGCSNVSFDTFSVSDVSGSGIMAGGFNHTDRNALEANQILGITFNNFTVTKAAAEYLGSVGVNLGYGENLTATYFTIHDLPYTGIVVGGSFEPFDGYQDNYLVEWGKVYNVMQVMTDGGGIYSNGYMGATSGIRNNLVYDVLVNPAFNYTDASTPLYADENSNGVEYRGNVLLKNSTGAQPAYWGKSNIYQAGMTSPVLFEGNYYQASWNYLDGGTGLGNWGTNYAINAADIASWPLEAQLVYYNAGAYGDKTTLVSRSGNTVTLYSWDGATIYADFDDGTPTTVRTSGEAFAIPAGATTLYYYAEDTYYTEDVKSLSLGMTMRDLSGNLVTSKSLDGSTVTSTPLGG
jgi:hypothetical protein